MGGVCSCGCQLSSELTREKLKHKKLNIEYLDMDFLMTAGIGIVVLTGIIALLFPRLLAWAKGRFPSSYRVVAIVLFLVSIIMQPLYFFFLPWRIAERPFPPVVPWPLVVFPAYIVLFFASLWMQKLQKVKEMHLSTAAYSSFILAWPLSVVILGYL